MGEGGHDTRGMPPILVGVSQEDTMEAALWGEAIGWSLGSYDAAELVGAMCHGNVRRQETACLHAIFCTKTGRSSLNYRVLHQALARSPRESKVQFVAEDTWSFRQRTRRHHGRSNPFVNGYNDGGGTLSDS